MNLRRKDTHISRLHLPATISNAADEIATVSAGKVGGKEKISRFAGESVEGTMFPIEFQFHASRSREPRNNEDKGGGRARRVSLVSSGKETATKIPTEIIPDLMAG